MENIINQPYQLIQELVDNIPDVIYFKDKKGRLILVNKAHAAGLGLTPQDVVGKTDFDFFPPHEARFMTSDDDRVMRTGVAMVDKIEWTTQPNGSRHCVTTTKIPRVDKDGNVVGIMGITRDITERVNVEEEIKKKRRELEQELMRLKDQLELEKNKLEQVLHIEASLNTIIKMERLVEFVVENTARVLEAEKCSLMLFDDRSQELCLKGQCGLDEKDISKTRFHLGESIVGIIAEEGRPVLVEDIEKDERFGRPNRPSYKSKSFISLPMKMGSHLIGVISVADKKGEGPNVFSELDLKILDTLARQVVVALENAKLYKELNFLTVSDPLTNMFNYRHFAKSLDLEIKRMNRYKEELCLLMLDVDHFKEYNDTFGHVAGDQLLKEISVALNTNIREVDIACRYAGDEFVIILPKTKLKEALIVADKIKSKVEKIFLKRKVTISIGAAQCALSMDRHDLTLQADAALYKAKREGRNRIATFTFSPL